MLTRNNSSNFSPLSEADYSSAYIHVFGRNSCGYTTRLLARLDQADVAYQYFNFDNTDVSDYVFKLRNGAGYTGNYTDIPVVDFNSEIRIRPDANKLIRQFKTSASGTGENGLTTYH